MNVTKEEIKQFLKDSIEWLIDQDMGCATLELDDRLAICVGWLDGYDENDEDVIHSKEEPKFAINAGIKVYTSDDMRTDYEFINSPYHDNGDVVQTDVSVKPNADLDDLTDYFIKEYESMKDLNMEEDGRIIEDDDFDDTYEPMEDEVEVEKDEYESNAPVIDTKLPTNEDLKNNLMITGNDGISYCKKNGKYFSNTGWREKEISKDEFDAGVAKVKREINAYELQNGEIKESIDGDNVIDDLVDRAKGMLNSDNYGDKDNCIRQAIDDGLIYTSDIRALADHYGTLPEDSELIEGFYDELYSDISRRLDSTEDEE